MTAKIQCSRCGKQTYASLYCNKYGITNLAHHWTTTGTVLYCPKCSKEVRSSNDFEDVVRAILSQIDMHYDLTYKWSNEQ